MSRAESIAAPVILGVMAMIAWEVSCRMFSLPDYILPRPSRIFAVLVGDSGTFARHAAITMFEALSGFLIANILAMLLAVGMVYVRGLDRAIMPFAIALKTTPIVAMAPLLLIWFGAGVVPKIAAAVLICFFPVLVNAIKGFGALEEGEDDLFHVYGASKTQLLLKLRFRRAAPYIFSALKVSSSLAVVGAIVGEFVGANAGIGYLILISSYHLETTRMFAALVMAAASGIIMYAVVAYYDRKIVFWLPSGADEVRLDSPRAKPRGAR